MNSSKDIMINYFKYAGLTQNDITSATVNKLYTFIDELLGSSSNVTCIHKTISFTFLDKDSEKPLFHLRRDGEIKTGEGFALSNPEKIVKAYKIWCDWLREYRKR